MSTLLAFPKPKHLEGRVVSSNRMDWGRVRGEVWIRDGGRCVHCRKSVPLNNIYDAWGELETKAAEIHHKSARKMGGGSRDDRPENLETACWKCHRKLTTPVKVVPSKKGL